MNNKMKLFLVKTDVSADLYVPSNNFKEAITMASGYLAKEAIGSENNIVSIEEITAGDAILIY